MSDYHGCDLVIDIPTSLSCSILSDLVSTVDLARLDSAYCCNEKRGVVLDLLQSKELICKDHSCKIHSIPRSRQYWDWILRRGIKLFHITVTTFGADVQKIKCYAKKHEKHIGHLHIVAVESPFSLHCKHLVQLTCNVKVNPAFVKVLQNNPNLQILDVRGLKEEHIESLKTIRLPHLTHLRLDGYACSAEHVEAVLTMPARLLKLDIWDINTDLTKVAKLCPHLRSLNLDMNYNVFESSPDFDLVNFTSHLLHLINLQLVDFAELQDTELLAIVRYLKQLRFLSLQFNDECNLTDTGIGHIADHCAATLEVFCLRLSDSVTHITSDSLDRLRASCTKLKQFQFKAPFEYSDIPLCSVSDLMLYWRCVDSTLVRIANKCPQLEVLQMKGGAADCTVSILRELCEKCPKLHRIELEYNNTAFAYVKSLAAPLTQLRVTDSFDDRSLDGMKMPIL